MLVKVDSCCPASALSIPAELDSDGTKSSTQKLSTTSAARTDRVGNRSRRRPHACDELLDTGTCSQVPYGAIWPYCQAAHRSYKERYRAVDLPRVAGARWS